ncbi:hypothetical protein ABLN87_04955 [Ruegeria sp. SCPT10]|uniref:TadE/TadG family type IV pilus assembly protein n=1 Tax=Ruegeria sp. SCP10 TaxID=3141377 RepID=UPI003336EDBD
MNRFNISLPRTTINWLGRFWRKEDGVVSIEAVMVFPLLFWSMWTSYTYFDSYRQSAINLKAAYAVADIISREHTSMSKQYITNMYELQKFLISDRSAVSMRISLVKYEADNDRHVVEWTCPRGESFEKLDNATLFTEYKDRIPVMADGAVMILVETKDWYTRPFKIGYGDHSFAINKFMFTQPRGLTNLKVVNPDDC